MKQRTLAGTDLRVSEIGFGLWTLATGRWGRFSEGEAAALLTAAFDRGINLFVTADVEGEGRGEELLAKALRRQRDALMVAVKVGRDFYHPVARGVAGGPPALDFSAAYLRLAVDKALQRLRTDWIDVLELQDITLEAVQDPELWAAIDTLRQSGKIRHAGAALAASADGVAITRDMVHLGRPLVIEHRLNLLESQPGIAVEAAVYGVDGEAGGQFEHGAAAVPPPHSVSLFVRGPHANGLLEGGLTPETQFPPHDPRSGWGTAWLRDGLQRGAAFQFLTGKETGRTLAQAALLWLLAEPAVASCLPNITSRERLDEFILATEKNPLTREELQRVQELMPSPE